jgi:hypothetical protein
VGRCAHDSRVSKMTQVELVHSRMEDRNISISVISICFTTPHCSIFCDNFARPTEKYTFLSTEHGLLPFLTPRLNIIIYDERAKRL